MSRLALCWMLLALPAAAQDRDILQDRAATLRTILYENILPFWLPQCIDREYGGYRLNHDITGQYLGDGDKNLVAQARMVWFFSRLFRLGLGDQRHLQWRDGDRALADCEVGGVALAPAPPDAGEVWKLAGGFLAGAFFAEVVFFIARRSMLLVG